MNATHLNEHDANQGAQSSGEFLGMTGNSGWYLLGSGGATILMVILLWGILGVSLLLCLLIGVVLCAGSVAYVFALRNNKPEHYDTDFFESALVEAGLVPLRFGPVQHQPANPFGAASVEYAPTAARRPANSSASGSEFSSPHSVSSPASLPPGPSSFPARAALGNESAKPGDAKDEPMVPRAAYEQLREELSTTEALLEDMLDGAREE